MNDPYSLTLEETPAEEDAEFVRQRLTEFNALHAPPDTHRLLAIFVRDENGAILAGLLGGTYWGWLHIDYLWVDEALRGAGYGRRLLAMAEQEAIRRGCHHAHLDTMSFQARAFYEKHGYEVFAELHDVPLGHSRISMKKALNLR